jgi:DNA repair ATPase RecN
MPIQTETRTTPRRRRYQQEVERLLDQIQRQVQELRRLKTAGASRHALAERKQRLTRTREQLANLVSATGPAAQAA